jgi:DNA polymerase III subunit delta
MLIALIGPDRFTVGQALKNHLAKYASSSEGPGDLNLTRLDGARISPDEMARAVQSYGFFDDRRVVVVEGLITRFAGRGGDGEGGEQGDAQARGKGKPDRGQSDAFARLFGEVPESTVLILVERGGAPKNSSLLKAAARYGKVEEYILPKGAALERWIARRAEEVGVKIAHGAQLALAAALPDVQTLANEIDKLALYVGPGGTIDERVLRDMSFAARQDDVFELTNAVARRDAKGALLQLQRLIDGGTAPEGILPALAWQVRTLIQVRDMLDRRVPEHYMAQQAGLSDFVVRKTVGQARQFTMHKLNETHAKLLALDHAVKTGRADADLSIDALVVEMCGA